MGLQEALEQLQVALLPRPLGQVHLGDVEAAIAEPLRLQGPLGRPVGAHGEGSRHDRTQGQGQHDAADQVRHHRIAPAPPPGPLRFPRRPRQDRLAGQIAVQVLRQGRGAGVPLPGQLLQALQADRLQVARGARVEPGRWLGRPLADLLQRLGHRLAAEGGPAGEQGVEDGAEAVDVAGGGHRAAPARGLLGRHVGRRPQDRPALRQLAVAADPPGQPEVADVGLAVVIDQDVGRLEVAVEDAALMRVVHRLGGLGHQPCRGARVGGVVGQPLLEARPADELHGEVAPPVVLADLEDRHDVRVVQQRDRLGLVLEPSQFVIAGQDVGPEHLEGDGPIEADLAGAVDDPHAAAAHLLDQLVVAEVTDERAGRERARVAAGPAPGGDGLIGRGPGRPRGGSGIEPDGRPGAGVGAGSLERRAGRRLVGVQGLPEQAGRAQAPGRVAGELQSAGRAPLVPRHRQTLRPLGLRPPRSPRAREAHVLQGRHF
jgi:hypothetical protein